MSYCPNPNCSKPETPKLADKRCPNCGMKLLLGKQYRAVQLIGKGGFGKTFLALDEYKKINHYCVIKQLHFQANNVKATTELFNEQAKILKQLGQHPQIPELLAHFEQDGHKYLVHEFIDGENLLKKLRKNGCFEEDDIFHILNNLLPILQFIHANNVIHRDIKPENIIQACTNHTNSQVTLVGFDTARIMQTSVPSLVTEAMIGTPEYMAREQANGRAVFASDIYSLGVTCIVLLTHMDAFSLESPYQGWVWRDYLEKPVSNRLGAILDKMIEKEISHRYQSAESIIKDLKLIEARKYFEQGQKALQEKRKLEAITCLEKSDKIYKYHKEHYQGPNEYQGEYQDEHQEVKAAINELNSLKYAVNSLSVDHQKTCAGQIFKNESNFSDDEDLGNKIYHFLDSWSRKEKKNAFHGDWDIIYLWKDYLLEIIQKTKDLESNKNDKQSMISKLKSLRNHPRVFEELQDISKAIIVLTYDDLSEKDKDEVWDKVRNELRAGSFQINAEDLKRAGLKSLLFGCAGLPAMLMPIIARILLQRMTSGILAWIMFGILGREALKRAALGFIGGPLGIAIGLGLAVGPAIAGFTAFKKEQEKAKFILAILSIYFLNSLE